LTKSSITAKTHPCSSSHKIVRYVAGANFVSSKIILVVKPKKDGSAGQSENLLQKSGSAQVDDGASMSSK
jgi:hypothetical protein